MPILPLMLETEGWTGGVRARLTRWLYRSIASALVASVLLVEVLRIRAGLMVDA